MGCDICFVTLGLDPPSRVREGQVTDTSIELLWDPAPGQDHSYEVICLKCESSQKVKIQQLKKLPKIHLFRKHINRSLYLISPTTFQCLV